MSNENTGTRKIPSRGGLIRRLSQHENSTMFLVLVLIIFVVFLIDFFTSGMVLSDAKFLSGLNISNVMLQVAVTGILALGMTLVMLMGGIDLSIGWMMCFVGTAMAYMLRNYGWSGWMVVLAGVVISVFFQLLMGFIISRTKLESFIVSLGFMSIYRGFTYLITNGREITLGGKFRFLGKTSIKFTPTFKIYTPVLIFIILAILIWLIMKYTKFGRRIYAVGGNEKAAFLSGINVKNFKLMVYGISGLFISVATMTQLSRLGTGNPLMGQGKEIDVIAAVVVGGTALSGGKGNIWGTVIGVILLGIISNALNILSVNPHYQYIMKGLLIIISVMIGYYSSVRKIKVKN
jgi:ribose/xylose/arabinose/galactoside ABC-type transport system permease subunit